MKAKNELYKKLMKTKNRDIQTQSNKIKNEFIALTRKNKEGFYKNYFKKHNDDLTKIWNGVKEIININKNKSSLLTSLSNKNRIFTDQK